MQSNENYPHNNGYFNNPYIIDTKLYLAAIAAALGLIFLFSFPFTNSPQASFTEFFQEVYDSGNSVSAIGKILVCFVTIVLVIMPISYAGYLITLARAPKMYIKYMIEGSEYRAQRLLQIINNNSTNKKVSIIYIIPVLFWFFVLFVSDIRPLKDMGSGFWLYSLCMAGMVFLIYTSQTPSLQAVANQYAKSNGESKKDDVQEHAEDNNWICPNPSCRALQNSNSKFCGICGTKRPDGLSYSNQVNSYLQGMKYYKFVIYVQLIFAPIIGIVTALMYFFGTIYDFYYAYLNKSVYQTMSNLNISEWVYSYYDGLRSVDIFFGIMLICLAVFNIYTRSQLVKYKRNAPTLFLVSIILSYVIGFVYNLLVANYTEAPLMNVSIPYAIGYIIGVIVFVVLNKIYFDKRRYLFVN